MSRTHRTDAFSGLNLQPSPTRGSMKLTAPEAFELALKLAKEKDADLVLATDPDADRLGGYVKDTKSGEYICLSGKMS